MEFTIIGLSQSGRIAASLIGFYKAHRKYLRQEIATIQKYLLSLHREKFSTAERAIEPRH